MLVKGVFANEVYSFAFTSAAGKEARVVPAVFSDGARLAEGMASSARGCAVILYCQCGRRGWVSGHSKMGISQTKEVAQRTDSLREAGFGWLTSEFVICYG